MDIKTHAVTPDWASRAYADDARYRDMYAASIRDPEAFWFQHGDRIEWFRTYTKVKNTSFGGPGTSGEVSIRWFEDGVTNVAHNCVPWTSRRMP